MDIKVSDWIKIPKGTTIYEDYQAVVTKRDVIVEVSKVGDGSRYENDHSHYYSYLSSNLYSQFVDELRKAQRKAQQLYYNDYSKNQSTNTPPSKHYSQYEAELTESIDKKYKELAIANLGGPMEMVFWSNNKKHTCAHRVVKVDAPKARKEPAINKRQQAVKKSVWKFTKDTEVSRTVDNPNFSWQAYHKGSAEPQYIEKVLGTIKEGQLFTITDKMSTSWRDEGLLVPMKSNDTGNEYTLRWTQVSPNMELVSMPEVKTYVARDKSTGLLYCGFGWESQKLEYSDKLTKARQFAQLNQIKTHFLEMGGYFHDLPGSENLPEWMGNQKTFDVPDSFEIVEYNKLNKTEIKTIDLQQFLSNTWRLRPLTEKFGSAVRNAFKDAEDADEVDKYKGLIVFHRTQKENYWDDEKLSKDEVKDITDAVKLANFKKGQYCRGTGTHAMAYTFEKSSQAMMVKLAYSGKLNVTVYDIDEMKEVTNA